MGVTRLNTGDIAFRKMLKDRGVDVSKIEFVELDSQATVVEAVKKGEVDLGIAFLTYRQSAEAQGLVPVSYLDGEEEWPGFISLPYVYHQRETGGKQRRLRSKD